MRFWVSVSLLAVLVLSTNAQSRGGGMRKAIVRNNETMLGGLVPGRSSLRKAITILGQPTSGSTWRTAKGAEIAVDLNSEELIQTVRMTQGQFSPREFNGCFRCVVEGRVWRSGLGLKLGSSADQVVQLYGEPDSRSPSTKDGQRLELLYYAFDWAGPDVPQVMEVVCTARSDGKPSVVVEITLAASSL